MVLVNYPASKLSMRVSRERGCWEATVKQATLFFTKKEDEKRKKLKKLQRKDQEGARFHRLQDSCCARSDIQQLQAFYQQTASLYCFLHCWVLKVEVLPYHELTMRCFVYFRSKEAVEEKLSSTLYPFASQRTASGAMSSNLGT